MIDIRAIPLGEGELKIISWFSRNPGKGESVRELEALKEEYSIIRVVDVHRENIKAVSFWRHMRSKGLIQNFYDDEGVAYV